MKQPKCTVSRASASSGLFRATHLLLTCSRKALHIQRPGQRDWRCACFHAVKVAQQRAGYQSWANALALHPSAGRMHVEAAAAAACTAAVVILVATKAAAYHKLHAMPFLRMQFSVSHMLTSWVILLPETHRALKQPLLTRGCGASDNGGTRHEMHNISRAGD